MSFNTAYSLPDVAMVDDSDILRFIPTSLGNQTAGAFEFFLDGSDVGLASNGEDIDAITLNADDQLVISTLGNARVPGFNARDEDLLILNNPAYGVNSGGSWSIYLDGSNIGLDADSEDIWGVWVDGESGRIALTTNGPFSVPGLSGGPQDIPLCSPATNPPVNACTYASFWLGDSFGFANEKADGIHVVTASGPNVANAIGGAQDNDQGEEVDDELDDDELDDDELDDDMSDDVGGQIFLPVVSR